MTTQNIEQFADVLKSRLAENNFEESAICNFAEQIGVDAGIVLGRLQKYGIVRFNQYGNLKR